MTKTYLGIDLHKRISSWVLISENREVLYKQTVKCTPDKIAKAIDKLPLSDTDSCECTLEPVCGWRWVREQLIEAGFNTHTANPLKTKLIASSRMKYDSIDAQTLAELTRADFLPESYVAPNDVMELRALIRERVYLVHTRSGLKIRLKSLVDARGYHELRDTCLQKSKQGLLKSIGDEEINRLLSLIESMDKHIAPLDSAIQKFARKSELAKLIMTIPAIGPISATTIIAEVGDFSRFKSAKQLASYAGLVPSQRSSAGIAKHGRITKQGSKYLRTTFVECAMRIRDKESDAPLYDFYQRVRKASSPMKARVALARKLATLVWYIATTNKVYNPLHSKDSMNRNDSVLFSGA